MFLRLLPPSKRQIYVENLIKAHALIMHRVSLSTFLSCVDFCNTGKSRGSLTLISELIFKAYTRHLSIWKVIGRLSEVKYTVGGKKSLSQWLLE